MNRRRTLATLLATATLGWSAAAGAQIRSGEDPDASPMWHKIRASLFQSRPISSAQADGVIAIEAPTRAEDAAIVPIAVRTRLTLQHDPNKGRGWNR